MNRISLQFHISILMFCSIVVFPYLSGCAALMLSSSCEQKSDPIERYQCFDERLFPDVAKGAAMGAVTGALLGWLIKAAMGGHSIVPVVVGGVIVAGAGGYESYRENREGKKETYLDVEKAKFDAEKAKFDAMADNRRINKLKISANEALNEAEKRFKANSITKQDFLQILKQVDQSSVKTMQSCNALKMATERYDETNVELNEELVNCSNNADELKSYYLVINQNYNFQNNKKVTIINK